MIKKCTSLLKCSRGVAYLEFAIILPFILALLMGSIEVSRYIIVSQKVEKTSITLSDVISQGKTISTSNLDNMIYASSQVMLILLLSRSPAVLVLIMSIICCWRVVPPAT